MTRMIDADALKEMFIQTLENIKSNPRMTGQEMHIITAIHTVGQMIDDSPTIDAVPVKRGKWIETDEWDEFYGQLYRCSNCNTFVLGYMDNYCSYCGADMRGEE